MKIKKIVALTAACAMLSSTAGCQIITIDGEEQLKLVKMEL